MEKSKLYFQILGTIFDDYKGDHSEILRYIPRLFNLMLKAHSDSSMTWKEKFILNAGLSYFAVAGDVYPGKEEATGYIDDLFVCSYVLKKISETHSKILLSKWGHKEGILKLLDRVLPESQRILNSVNKDTTKQILQIIGIYKLNELINENEDVFSLIGIKDRIGPYKHKKSELMGIIKTILVAHGHKNLRINEYKHLKRFYGNKEWSKAKELVQEMEMQEMKYDNTHERELDKIKTDILLKLDESILDD
tara:strand:+ start:2618 stop:3367 length:750 start_codon:yes stop_codon:yes gene_type:complete